MMFRQTRASAEAHRQKVEAQHKSWIFLYGQEGAAWLMVMLEQYYRERPLTIDQAIFAVDQWARTSVMIFEEVGHERLLECQQLALAAPHPHYELRNLYLQIVSPDAG